MAQKLLNILKNKYALTTIIFIAWIFTFESTNIFRLIEYKKTINSYQDEIEFYQEKILSTKESIEELEDPILLEKFAREQYYMKKDNEVIFVYHPTEN